MQHIITVIAIYDFIFKEICNVMYVIYLIS